MKPRKIAILVLLPVFLALSVGWCTMRDNLLEYHFGQILPGMSAQQVVAIMGTPSWDDRCGSKMLTGLPAQCTREFGYAVTLHPITPRYYLIWFGNDDRVVDTAPITSP